MLLLTFDSQGHYSNQQGGFDQGEDKLDILLHTAQAEFP
jgi:hypothetical protein